MSNPSQTTPEQPTAAEARVIVPPRVGLDVPQAASGLRVIAGYIVEQELGRGGMGVVYKASQVSLSRPVALKMILHADDVSEQRRQRFVREAESLARLHHPHIVQIFEAGLHEGKPFFSMEYVDGGSLDKQLAGTPLSANTAARLLATLASAMQHAHDAGLIHRDLKPANVLLARPETSHGQRPHPSSTDQHGKAGTEPKTPKQASSGFKTLPEKRVNPPAPPIVDSRGDPFGTPKISDFGLAKDLAEQGSTRSGEVMGTPSYMAPEQASGKVHLADARVDVYALGAIFYECLTGRPPFKAATAAETLVQVLTQETVPPRHLQPSTPRDLDTICLKCLQKDRNKRYGSAHELAQDCEAFLRGEPIKARPVGRVERAWRWTKRRPLTGGLIAAVVMLLVLGVGGITWALGEALRESNRARDAETDADRQRGTAVSERDRALTEERIAREQRNLASARAEELQRALFNSRIPLAEAAWRDGRVLPAHERLDEVPRELRFWDWNLTRRVCSGGLFTLRGHEVYAVSVTFSPDRQRLASGDVYGVIKVWDALDGRELLTLRGHRAAIHALAFSPDGRRLASAGGDGAAKVWDVQGGAELLTLRRPDQIIGGVAYSPDGRRLATACTDRTVRLWDAGNGKELLVLKGHTGIVQNVCFSPDGRRLASASGDSTVRIWDARTGQSLLTLAAKADTLNNAAFSPDGQHVIAIDGPHGVKVWDATTGRELRSFAAPNLTLNGVAFSPDGQALVVAAAVDAQEFTVRLWDFADGRERLVLRGHSYLVHGVAFSPDGQRVASVGWDQTVKVWDVRDSQLVTRLLRGQEVVSVAFSPDSRRLATAEKSGLVRVWETATERQLLTLPDPGRVVAFSPDGQWLAIGAGDGTIKLLEAGTGQVRHVLKRHQGAIRCLVFRPAGTLLSGSADGEMKIWDLGTRRELHALTHTGGLNGLALAPGGQIASAGSDGTVRVWDGNLTRELHVLREHRGAVTSVCFSADGSLLASGGDDRVVRIWDARTGQQLRALWGHGRGVVALDFARAGARLASTGKDGSVKVWDAATGQEQLSLTGYRFGENIVAFSPDGLHLASAGQDGVRVWYGGAPPEEVVLRGHTRKVHTVAFSPNSARLVSAGEDALVKVWDVKTGQEQLTLTGMTSTPLLVAFSRDGRRVVATTGGQLDVNPVVWDARTGARLAGASDTFGDGWMTLSPNGQRMAIIHDNLIQLFPVLPPTDQESQTRRRWTRLDVDWHTAEAKRHEAAGRWHPVAFHLGWLATERPRDAALLARLAEVLARLGRRDEALRHATRALLIDPKVKLRLDTPPMP